MITIVEIAAGAAAPAELRNARLRIAGVAASDQHAAHSTVRKFGIVQRVRPLDVPCCRSGRELFCFEISSSPASKDGGADAIEVCKSKPSVCPPAEAAQGPLPAPRRQSLLATARGMLRSESESPRRVSREHNAGLVPFRPFHPPVE